jgi:predicted RNase H-like HicB family nuclease
MRRSIVNLRIELEQEEDGRWLAEAPDLPGVLVYGKTKTEAVQRVKALVLRVLADRLEHGEPVMEVNDLFALPA